jgi:hypothetical protein
MAFRIAKASQLWHALGPETSFPGQLAISGVAVEKLNIHKNSMIFWDGKWSDAPHKSFIGHPDATLFWTSPRI